MKNKQLITTCLVGVTCALIAALGTTVYFNYKDKEETPIVTEEAIEETEVAETPIKEEVKEEPEEQPTLQKAKANTTKNKKITPQVEEVAEEKEETKTAETTKKDAAETTTVKAETPQTTTVTTNNNTATPQPVQEVAQNTPSQPAPPSEPAPTQPTQPSEPAPTQPTQSTVIESSIPADAPLFNGDRIVDPTNPAVSDVIVDDVLKDIINNQ